MEDAMEITVVRASGGAYEITGGLTIQTVMGLVSAAGAPVSVIASDGDRGHQSACAELVTGIATGAVSLDVGVVIDGEASESFPGVPRLWDLREQSWESDPLLTFRSDEMLDAESCYALKELESYTAIRTGSQSVAGMLQALSGDASSTIGALSRLSASRFYDGSALSNRWDGMNTDGELPRAYREWRIGVRDTDGASLLRADALSVHPELAYARNVINAWCSFLLDRGVEAKSTISVLSNGRYERTIGVFAEALGFRDAATAMLSGIPRGDALAAIGD